MQAIAYNMREGRGVMVYKQLHDKWFNGVVEVSEGGAASRQPIDCKDRLGTLH